MRLRRAAWAAVAASVLALGALPLAAQETQEKKEDVVAKGYHALQELADSVRVVIAPNTGQDVLMVAEYDDGAVALFGSDGKKTSLVHVDSMNQALLLEALLRAKSRQDWRARNH